MLVRVRCTFYGFLTLDKVSLLPLTASLYVPGRIVDTDKVIVDVGTGYYVEKVRCSFSVLLSSRRRC